MESEGPGVSVAMATLSRGASAVDSRPSQTKSGFVRELTTHRTAYSSHHTAYSSTALEAGEEDWSKLRLLCRKLLQSHAMESVVALLVLLNFAMVVVETDASVDNGVVPTWVRQVDLTLLLVFVLELSARFYVFRCRFFRQFFNVMDLAIALADISGELYSWSTAMSFTAFSPLRIFRLLRLARGMEVILRFPQLALLVKGMVGAMSAIFWGSILLTAALAVLGILAVQFIHPLNQRVSQSGTYGDCERCHRAFASVGESMLTFVQQIVAGDSWGLVTIPIIEEQPLSALFFGFVFIVVSLTIMNVILSVIVDSALKVSQGDLQEVIRAKNDEFRISASKFRRICKEMDKDGSGDLTLEELLQGYRDNTRFKDNLTALDIREDDLALVFAILDKDVSGRVDYEEFTEELFRMKEDNQHTLLVFIRFYVLEIRRSVQEQLHMLKSEIMEKLEEEQIPYRSQADDGDGGEIKLKSTGTTLGEELRLLRALISEDLVRSAKEHTHLLRSMAGHDVPMHKPAPPSQLQPLVLNQPRSSWAEGFREGEQRLQRPGQCVDCCLPEPMLRRVDRVSNSAVWRC